MTPYNPSGVGAPIPVVAIQSAAQAALNAGTENTVGVSLPPGFVLPARLQPGNVGWVIGSVVASPEANVEYLVQFNNFNSGTSTLTLKVRNTGTANGTAQWVVNILVFGAGDALGI